MATPRLTLEQLQETIELVDRYGTVTKAANATGTPRTSLQERYNRAKLAIPPPPKAAVEPPREVVQERERKNSARRAPIPDDIPPRRHVFIGDLQLKPGVPMDHLPWIGGYVAEKKFDVIVIGGDLWDLPSLNKHEQPGSLALEGSRFKDDIDAGNHGLALLDAPIRKEMERDPLWQPEKEFTEGNHEFRAETAARLDPKWMGTVGSHHCNTLDYKWHPFLEVVEIDGVSYCHYFKMQNSKNAVGGSSDNRLNKIGRSHVQGHQVGFLYGNRVYPDGRTLHSLTAGSAYLHAEDYRGPQCNKHFRGIVALNEVRDGDFGIMPVSLDFLCRKNTGMSLYRYMRTTYPDGEWEHLR